MYKNIKVLNKKEFTKVKYQEASLEQKLKNTRLVPIGINEVFTYNSIAPILISNTKDKEFTVYLGLNSDMNILTANENIKEPELLKNYPFSIINAKDKDNKIIKVVGIDNNKQFINEDEGTSIFENNELSEINAQKVKNIKILEQQRQSSRVLIKELEKYDLLIKQSFNIKVQEEIKVVIKEFYIINSNKLKELEDKVLILWAKKGWIGIIDAHIYSINNFKNILSYVK